MVVQLVRPLDVCSGHPQGGALMCLGAGADLHGVCGVFQEGIPHPRVALGEALVRQ